MHIKRAPYAGFTLDALTYQFRVRIVGKFDLVFFAMIHNCDWFQLFSGILIFLLHSLFIHFCSGLCNVFTHHVQKALLKLFWTVINAYVASSKYWRPIVTHTWLVLDTQGIRHDTSQNDQFALAVVLIRESSHRKTHFPRRYPDTFLFSPGVVNRLSVHLASVKKKKKNDCLRLRKLQLQILSGRREGTLLNFCWYSILGGERLPLEINTSPSLGRLHRTDTLDRPNERELSRVMSEYIRDLWRVTFELPF